MIKPGADNRGRDLAPLEYTPPPPPPPRIPGISVRFSNSDRAWNAWERAVLKAEARARVATVLSERKS